MYKTALKKAQSAEEKKVGFNLQLPVGLKKDFEKLCKVNSVSVTSMIVSLIEVSLEESALAMEPLIEESIDSLKKVLNTDNVFYPNPIQLNNPMYSKIVSKDEWKLLLSIYKDLCEGEDVFIKNYGPSDQVEHTVYQEKIIDSVEAAKRYIEQIARNIKCYDDIQKIYTDKMDNFLKERSK